MTIIVRAATPSHAEEISALVHEVAPTLGYGTEAQMERFLDECYSPAVIRAGIDAATHRWLIVNEPSGALCGAVYLNPAERYFGGLHVRHRGQGVGRALLSAMLELADQLGVAFLQASVIETNKPMLALTAQYGFQVIGDDPDKVYFLDAPLKIITRRDQRHDEGKQ